MIDADSIGRIRGKEHWNINYISLFTQSMIGFFRILKTIIFIYH